MDDKVLDLYVPVTDIHGYDRGIALYDPPRLDNEYKLA
jgi:hypothetical protein